MAGRTLNWKCGEPVIRGGFAREGRANRPAPSRPQSNDKLEAGFHRTWKRHSFNLWSKKNAESHDQLFRGIELTLMQWDVI